MDGFTCSITKSRLVTKKIEQLTQNGNNQYELLFEFDSTWQKMNIKQCQFNNKIIVLNVNIIDNKCLIPSEILNDSNNFSIGIIGVSDDVTYTTNTVILSAKEAPITGAILLGTPTEWEQYILQMERILQETTTISEHMPIIGDNRNWWIWDVNQNAYVDSSFVSAIKGDTGEQGEQGDPITPIQLTQSEYDALTTEDKENGDTYYIEEDEV